MRTLISRLLVLGLIWMMTPGLTEAAENLWHLARAGHSAHSQNAGPDHAPDDEEHGCSGAFHLCSCHHSPPLAHALAPADCEVTPPSEQCELSRPRYLQSPDLPGLFRPPQA